MIKDILEIVNLEKSGQTKKCIDSKSVFIKNMKLENIQSKTTYKDNVKCNH